MTALLVGIVAACGIVVAVVVVAVVAAAVVVIFAPDTLAVTVYFCSF
jgi:hypothetical protein